MSMSRLNGSVIMVKAYTAKTREICITIGPATGKNFYGWLYAYSFQRLQKISPSRSLSVLSRTDYKRDFYETCQTITTAIA